MARRGWILALLVGTFAALATWPLSIDIRQDVRGLAVVSFVVIAAVRVKRDPTLARRPWLFLIAGSSLGFIGTLLAAFRYDYAIPSPADPVIYLSYLVVLLALSEFNRARTTSRDLDEILDAGLVACAAAVVIFAGILSAYLSDTQIPSVERIANGTYASLTVLMVGAIARLAVAPGTRNTSWRLLTLSIASIVISDLLIVLSTAGIAWGYTAWTIFGSAPFVLGTASVLHPTAANLTDPPPPQQTVLTRARIVMVGFALLIIPVVLITSLAIGHGPKYPLVIAGSVALSLLSLVRLTRLFRTQESIARIDGWLRRAGSGLLASHTTDEIIGAALSALDELIGSAGRIEFWTARAAGTFEIRGGDGAPTAVELPEDVDARLTETGQISLTRRDALALDAFRDGAILWMTRVASEDGSTAGVLAVVTDVDLPDAVRRAMQGLSGQIALALQSAELSMRLARERIERRFRALIENSSDIVWILADDGRVTFVSPAIAHVLHRDESGVIGTQFTDVVDPADHRSVGRALSWVRGGTSALPIEARLLSDSGDTRWFELVWRDLRNDEEIRGLVVNAREITDRKLADERMARSEARFRALVQHSSDMVIVIEPNGFVQYVSPSVPQVLGARSDSLIGSKISELMGPAFDRYMRTFQQPFGRMDFEVQTATRHGKPLELVITASDLRHEPAVGGIVLNARDVTAHRTLQEDLRRRTSEDELTGLANRNTFVARVNEHLRAPDRTRCAVLSVDLDDFKTVNDGLGTSLGDQVLFTIAERIRQNLRFGDLAARLTGDEFAVFLASVNDVGEACSIAERLIDVIAEPVLVGDEQLVISASIGVAPGDAPDAGADGLLRDADTALHVAKREGKKRATKFEARMRADASDRFELKSGLRRGIYYGELVDLYQPKVSMLNDRITGSEVLVRWQHPERGMLGPNSFIPLAEETGLIVPLGQWVLEHAIANLKRWNSKLPADRQLDVSVNVSARQLEVPEAVDRMIEAVERSGINPALVVLELTESLFVAESGVQREQIERLYRTGFRLSVDDFGTGYSSLRYLEQLPINEIKIDRSFIEGVDRSVNKQAVLTRIVELAADLGYRTVAEGIEGGAELEIVRRVGCDYGQGYYFSRPISVERFEDLVGISVSV